MNLWLPYDPPNWNEYINLERANYHIANELKQREKWIVGHYCKGMQWKGSYPITVEFIVHFKDRRKDVDNSRIKGILDGLVTCGVIRNDNLTCIRKVVIDSVIDNVIGVEINLEEYTNEAS